MDGQFSPGQDVQMVDRGTQAPPNNSSATITYLSTPTPEGADQSTYTFTAAIPSKAYDWVCLVPVAFGSAGGAKSLDGTSTIAGVTATVVGQHNPNASNNTGLLLANIPASTSGDLVVQFSGGAATRCAPVVYEMLGANTTAHATATDGTTDPTGSTINIPANGALIAIAASSGTPTDETWTGATEDVSALVETSRRYSSASQSSMSVETGRTVSCDWSGGTPATSSFFAASFPAA